MTDRHRKHSLRIKLRIKLQLDFIRIRREIGKSDNPDTLRI